MALALCYSKKGWKGKYSGANILEVQIKKGKPEIREDASKIRSLLEDAEYKLLKRKMTEMALKAAGIPEGTAFVTYGQ